MDYLSRGAQCIGDTCYRVGSAIGRTAVQGIASIPTLKNLYRSQAREAIARLGPDAMRFYREAYVQGAVLGDGRIDRDSLRAMGFFRPGYPFPGGPIPDADVPFRELQRVGLIYFPGRNRYGRRGGNNLNRTFIGEFGRFVEGTRQTAQEWGVREPNEPFLPNVIHGERRNNPYVNTPAPAVVDPNIFDVPRQPIYGSPDFESPLTFDRIPEGTNVIRITGRTGANPDIATYPIPEEAPLRRTFLGELALTRRNIATSAPFTPDQIQRGPYRYRRTAVSNASNKKKDRRRKTRKQ